MNKIFIDAGANLGTVSAAFYKEHKDEDFIFHLFEPNTGLFDTIYKNMKEVPRYSLHPNAVWIQNSSNVNFYLSRKNIRKNNKLYYQDGSSLLRIKKTGNLDYDNPIRISTIDFSEWVVTYCKKKDYIVLKMDIEGAEYSVLTKMIETGSIDYIDKLYVEFHDKKQLTTDYHKEYVFITQALKDKQIEFYRHT